MRKFSSVAVLVILVMMLTLVFVSCNDPKSPADNTVTVTISDKTVTEVFEGSTLQLAVTKDPESTEVEWVTSDANVATVSANGLVTGVAAGTATISVKVGDAVKDSLVITVKAYTVDINSVDSATVYVSKGLQLTVTKSPATAVVTWSSSAEAVATVNADGLVTGVSAGSAVITATCGSATDTITVTVKDTVIDTAVNADKFDMSGLYQDNAVLSGNTNSFAAFRGEASSYYVASATVAVSEPSGVDTWSRVGISHYNGDKYYGLQLSPGPDFNARKTVTMVINAAGDVEWGNVTDRSQVWNQHNLGAIDFSAVTLTAVRAGNEYYAYINGELYYYEAGIEGFDDIDTVPVLNLGSCAATFSDMRVAYGEEAVETYLATADDAIFYASSDLVVIGEDGSITFTGASDGASALNAKDHAAKSIGAAAMLPADVESSISFDLTINAFGSRDALPALAVTMNRYDGTYAEARSLVIGQYQAGWTGWNSNGDLNAGIGGPNDYTLNGEQARLEEGSTYKVIVYRLMVDGNQDNRLVVADSEGNVLFDGTWGWSNDGYAGRASVSFLCRDLDCTISNIVIA